VGADLGAYAYAASSPATLSDPSGLYTPHNRFYGNCGYVDIWVVPQGGGRINVIISSTTYYSQPIVFTEYVIAWTNWRTGRSGWTSGGVTSWSRTVTVRWRGVYTNTGGVFVASVLEYWFFGPPWLCWSDYMWASTYVI
jgi:hypothetical protein